MSYFPIHELYYFAYSIKVSAMSISRTEWVLLYICSEWTKKICEQWGLYFSDTLTEKSCKQNISDNEWIRFEIILHFFFLFFSFFSLIDCTVWIQSQTWCIKIFAVLLGIPGHHEMDLMMCPRTIVYLPSWSIYKSTTFSQHFYPIDRNCN